MSVDDAIERLVKRDKVIALGGLSAVVLLSWAYVLSGAGLGMSALEMTSMSGDGGMAPMAPMAWDLGYAWLMFLMWWIMMIAMMLPSAAPMVLLFAGMNRRQREIGNPYVATAYFSSAYLVVWAGFSLVAAALQWGLQSLALLSPMLMSNSSMFGAAILLVAGLYQLMPFKQTCLKNCRSPLQFMMVRWRTGNGGAFRMGIEHGAYCVGCCWFLMGLLFFGGVMNLYWIIGIAAYVMVEKSIPAGHWVSYGVGVLLILWGLFVLFG